MDPRNFQWIPGTPNGSQEPPRPKLSADQWAWWVKTKHIISIDRLAGKGHFGKRGFNHELRVETLFFLRICHPQQLIDIVVGCHVQFFIKCAYMLTQDLSRHKKNLILLQPQKRRYTP